MIADIVADEAPCPRCGSLCPRHSLGTRRPRGVNGVREVRYSKHYCRRCGRHFSLRAPWEGGKGTRYTPEFRAAVIAMVESGMTRRKVSRRTGVPDTTIFDWMADVRAL